MFTKKRLLIVVLILGMTTIILAQPEGTIVFISRPGFIDDDTGESPDMPHIYALQDQGYDVVIFYNASLSTASSATMDTLENVNLIIMGRSTPSADYGNHKETWNEIMVPTLCLEMWAIRNNRLNWLNTTNIPNITVEDSVINATIEVPDDPVFEDLDTSAPVPWIISPCDIMGVTEAGNGTVLARTASDSLVLFVRWEPDESFYPETFDYPAGHRTLIGNGRDNASTVPFDYYNFTTESEQVFLAEVARMFELGGGILPTAVRDEMMKPAFYALSQNYPNPFNPMTIIEFSLEKPGHTTIQVFNERGQLVETLVNQHMDNGTHNIPFHGNNLSAGVYYYRIQLDDFTNVKKMILLK